MARAGAWRVRWTRRSASAFTSLSETRRMSKMPGENTVQYRRNSRRARASVVLTRVSVRKRDVEGLSGTASSVPASRPIFVLAVAVYAGLLAVEAARVALRSDLRLFPIVLTIFPLMHAAHGLGLWEGLLRRGRARAS